MLPLTKTLGMLVMPLGLLWLGLLLATVLAWRRQARALGCLLGLLVLGVALAGNIQVGHALLARLEATVPSIPESSAPVEALFVLGGGTEAGAPGHPLLGDKGDRIVEAARLWHAGRAKLLVASGTSDNSRAGRRNLGAEARDIWKELGIPDASIRVVPEPCFITRDEIKAYKRLTQKEGWHRVGLLSSAWHLPRALNLARQEGLEVIPFPSDRRGRIPRLELWHLVPQAEGLEDTQLACWEMLGRWAGH